MSRRLPGMDSTITAPPPHVEPSHPRYRPDIDGLRAVAVWSVVVFHAFPSWLRGGFIGVDVFFVISGFLISTIIFENLERGTFSFAEFYARRFRRIFPTLLVVLFTSFAFGWVALQADDFQQLGKHIAGGAGFISNYLLWHESGYFDKSAESKPLLHLWSLGIEEQFYLIWPLLLWLAFRQRIKLLWATVAVAVLSFVLNVKGIGTDPVATFYLPQTRFWELSSGSLLAWTTLHRPAGAAPARSDGRSLAGLSLLLLGFWGMNRDLRFPGLWAVVPVAGALLIISAGPTAWVNRRLLSNRLIVWFGLISFPLYLWHWPLLSFARLVQGDSPSKVVRLEAVAAAVLLAWAAYRWVEKPLRFGGHGPLKVAALLAAMALVGLLGYTDFARDGLPSRFPPQVGQLFSKPDFSYPRFDLHRDCAPFQGSTLQFMCDDARKPSIFVIGDSHAESLMYGLKHLQETHPLGVSAAIACGNVPYLVLGTYGDEVSCEPSEKRLRFNLAALERIATIRPDVVILHARWAFESYHTDRDAMVVKLRQTISRIHEASPASKVLVLGPVPNWKSSPQAELWKSYLLDRAHPVPARMRAGQDPEIAEWDRRMARDVPSMGATYVSSYQVLCNGEGCLARVGEQARDMTAIDYGHLSPTGSIYLVEHIQDALLRLLPAPGLAALAPAGPGAR